MKMRPGFPITADDLRADARRRLPRFLFDYLDGGAGAEQTLNGNVAAWSGISLRQRVLVDVDNVDTGVELWGERCAQPLALAPIGLAGLMARRGEARAVRAANAAQVPFTLSTVGVCGLDEVAAAATAPFWFQLYWLRDRGLVKDLLDHAHAAGCRTLVFTVDLPVAGLRHRDSRNGMDMPGPRSRLLRARQLLARPGWIWRVALRGRPLELGSLRSAVPSARNLEAFRRFIDTQFDPGVTWADLAWLRSHWPGRIVLKGVLDPADAERAVIAGVDGLIVSNHGGRQLDGAVATATALPRIAAAVGSRTTLLVDGGIRSGVDVFRAIALGAHGAMIGRPWIYAMASGGEDALAAMLGRWQRELATTMALVGVKRISDIGAHLIDRT